MEKYKINKKIIPFILLALTFCIFTTGCRKDDVKDKVVSVIQSTDENVLFVKNGSPSGYPDQTYGEAFEDFFTSPTWKYFSGTKEGPDDDGDGEPDSIEKNIDVVEFTGYCMYQDVEVKALIQFTLDKEAGTFEPTFLSLNDVPQNGLMLIGLINKVFDGEEFEEKMDDTLQEDIEITEDALSEDRSSSNKDEGDYALLQEFIDLLNLYSDPPQLMEDELEEYYKGEYDLWKSGQGYSNITIDNKGHLQIADHSEEYVGYWSDSYSQRCNMTIECNDGIYYYIDIYWGSSAWDSTHWSFIGTYDSNLDGIVYWGSRIEEYYPENGETQETYVYNNGEGFLYIEDGILYWNDYMENVGADCMFEKMSY